MNKLCSGKKYPSYICIFVLIFLAYCMYIPFHYSSDGWIVFYTYGLIDGSQTDKLSAVWPEAVSVVFSGGRYIKGAILLLVGFCAKLQWLMSPLVSAIGVCTLAIAGCTAWNAITEHQKIEQTSVLPFLCLLIAFCQPFFTDWFQFSECQLFYPFGVFAAVYSAQKAFSTENISTARKWCFGCVWLMVGAGIYQITMQWFVLMSMAIVVINTLNNTEYPAGQLVKHVMFQILYALSIYAATAAVQLLFTRVFFYSFRIGAEQLSLEARIAAFLQAQKNLWKMTPYTKNNASILFPVVCILTFFTSVVFTIKSHSSRGVKIVRIATMLICTFGFYASIFLPIFFTESWYPQRTLVGFWGLPLLLSLAVTIEKKPCGKGCIALTVPVAVAACMIIVNIYSCLLFGSDLYRVNAMDTMRAQLIEEQIEAYEEDSGTQVQCLAFHYDSNPMYTYPGTVNSYENNLSAWSAAWNPLAIMNISSGKSYEECEYSDEMYYERYRDKNWDLYSPEQVFFVDETAYIVIY